VDDPREPRDAREPRETRVRLLTRHFLRRFADNDLISPHADRHEVLTATVTGFITTSLFVTIFLTVKFLFGPFQTPGRTSILLLDDRTFLLTCSMTLMALVAVAQWDALALDARDASILGTLPVPHGLLVRAKLMALVLFAVGFALGLAIIPAIVHPALSAARLDIQIVDGLRLMAAHAAANLAAGGFGFLAVLALREAIRALIGQLRFRRVSAVLQASLVLILVTTFLLAPALTSRVAMTMDAEAGDAARVDAAWIPSFWFLGLQQTFAGDAIDRLPRGDLPPGVMQIEDEATTVFRRIQPRFAELAGIAVMALSSTAALAFAAFLWNSRKLPAPLMARRSARAARLRAMVGLDRPLHTATRLIAGSDPVSRAGFLFTLRALSRSASHRVTMMASTAVGVAAAAVLLRGVDLRPARDVARDAVPGVVSDAASAGLSVFAIQIMLIAIVLFGFRHVLRVPAELRANWGLQLAWPRDEGRFLTGVRRAAFAGLGLPLLVILVPLHLVLLGPRLAAMHFLFGALITLAGLDLATLGLRKPPFASGYASQRNLKAIVPLAAPVALGVIFALARLERFALRDARGVVMLYVAFVLVRACLRVLDARQRERRRAAGEPVEWDELPAALQRIDLNG
jgi:hypothetical protein